MKTLDECKNEVANKYGHTTWNAMRLVSDILPATYDEVTKLYVTSQIEDLTKEVESKKESIRILMKQLDTQQESNDRYREALEPVTTAVIEFLEKQPDKLYIASSQGSWTTHQLAYEIRKQTPVGIDVIKSMMLLTADLILRGKEKIAALHPLVKEGE